MAHTPLTTGALARICQGEEVLEPVLQVLGNSAIAGGGGTERFCLVLNDGQSKSSLCILATQLNQLVHDNKIPLFSVIRLKQHVCKQVEGQAKHMVIVKDLEVLHRGETVGVKIGNPVTIGRYNGIASSQFGSSGIIDQESLNCGAVFITFLSVVLPVLKPYVLDKMKHYYSELKKPPIEVRQPNHKLSLKDRLPTDPHRSSVRFNIPITQKTIQDHNELAILYLSAAQRMSFNSLDDCNDYRILLTLMSAGCFSDQEAMITKTLRNIGNYAAHTQVGQFSNDDTKKILDDIEELLLHIPLDTRNQRRDLQQVKKYGALALLMKRTGQQITAIRRSLERAGLCMHPSVRASIQATLTSEEAKFENIELSEKNMKGKWKKIILMDGIFCEEIGLVSLKGSIAGLQSILSTTTPKTQTNVVIGKNFRVCELPFAKGTSRLAYRGRFDNTGEQDVKDFKLWAEVVIKVSKDDATNFLKMHNYATAFADEWTKIRGEEEIRFLWIKIVELPQFEGRQTMEPCLNRKLYKKW